MSKLAKYSQLAEGVINGSRNSSDVGLIPGWGKRWCEKAARCITFNNPWPCLL